MKWARREGLANLASWSPDCAPVESHLSLIITGEHDGISHSDSALERLVLFMPL